MMFLLPSFIGEGDLFISYLVRIPLTWTNQDFTGSHEGIYVSYSMVLSHFKDLQSIAQNHEMGFVSNGLSSFDQNSHGLYLLVW